MATIRERQGRKVKELISTDLIGARVAHMQTDLTPREDDRTGIVRGIYVEDGVTYLIAEMEGGRHLHTKTGIDVEKGRLVHWYLHQSRVIR